MTRVIIELSPSIEATLKPKLGAMLIDCAERLGVTPGELLVHALNVRQEWRNR